MMRDSAKQKNEGLERETTAARLEKVEQTLERMSRQIGRLVSRTSDATVREGADSLAHPAIIDRLEQLRGSIEEASSAGKLDALIEATRRTHATLVELDKSRPEDVASSAARAAEGILRAAKTREGLAEERMEEARAMRAEAAEARKRAAEVLSSAKAELAEAGRVRERASLAVGELRWAASWLGLKGAGVVLLAVLVAMGAVWTAGGMWMESEGLEVSILDEGERDSLGLGQRVSYLWVNHWTEEQRDVYRALIKADQKDETTTDKKK